jgi:hypothetical protein
LSRRQQPHANHFFASRDYEAFLLYAIGPQYCGGLDSVKLSSFYCPELITPGFLDSFPEANDLLLNPTQFGLASLHEHIVFFLNPHTRQFGMYRLEKDISHDDTSGGLERSNADGIPLF